MKKIEVECSDHNGVVDLSFSDQFWDINKRDEHSLDVFGLIGHGITDLLDVSSYKSITAIAEDRWVRVDHTDLHHLLCLVARLLQ
jgi:hypothetical protein